MVQGLNSNYTINYKTQSINTGAENDTLGKSPMDPWVAVHVMGQYLSLYERPFP